MDNKELEMINQTVELLTSKPKGYQSSFCGLLKELNYNPSDFEKDLIYMYKEFLSKLKKKSLGIKDVLQGGNIGLPYNLPFEKVSK